MINYLTSSFFITLALYALTVAARSVSENSQNQLVRQSSNKLAQSAAAYTNGNQNRCQQGWMWFNNKCWVTTQSRRNFEDAKELCKKQYNSTLPTIHSEDENEFLRHNVPHLDNSPIWLYARHNHQYNRTRWLDKTPVNYTRWDSGQPTHTPSIICIMTADGWFMKKAEPVNGGTECVSFWKDAKWGTQVGCLILLPVVCEKKLTPVSRLTEEPNGSLTSQYEQQQMVALGSGANSILFDQSTLLPAIILIISRVLTITPIRWFAQ